LTDITPTPQPEKHKPRRWVRRLTITGVAIAAVIGLGALLVWNHPQVVVGAFQGYQSQNSFEPRATPADQVRDNGIRYLNDIEYGTRFPNSYLDISYPAGATEDNALPTIVYTHGGGFFGGDKVLGDPLAVDSDVNFLFDRIIEQGYAVANVNYALVPEHHFPTPVRQLDEALAFLRIHAAQYGLDMDNVIIMGSSAGAIMTSQYGAALANPQYAKLLDVTPSIPLESVRALVVDDAPLEIDDFNFATMALVGNYIDGTMHPSKTDRERYNPIDHVTSSYPPSILLGSNYNGDGYARDMELLSDALTAHDVRHEFFYEARADGSEEKHGFLAGLPTGDPIAADALEQMLDFLQETPVD
jgi:acetyl esterase/lipase